jgi:exodeoxyribonuclease VIII
MSNTNIMLDLETMGTGTDAAIIAIGAVIFDKGGVSKKFYEVVDLQSSIDAGLTVTGSTVMWWLGQSEAARDALNDSPRPLKEVLQELTTWMRCTGLTQKIWGNGASFDNVILRSAYKKSGLAPPWAFWNDRCYRTIKSMYPGVYMNRVGEHHNALDDAESQARHLVEINAFAGSNGTGVLE